MDADERRDEASELPEGLARELAALHRPPFEAPPEFDRAVASMAVRAFTKRRLRVVHRRRHQWAAAAAIVVVSTGLAYWLTRPEAERPIAAVRAEDVDGNGRVDILDAFALARALEIGEGENESRDVNGDGRVDREDVERVAVEAVALR